MREILFRGKRIDNGEWVEGSLLFDPDLGYKQIIGFEYWTSETGRERGEFSELVDTNTVGQYTGLNDKNGMRIFEGDICRVGNLLYKVEFKHSSWWFTILSNKVYCCPAFNSHCGEYCEVIGNIHDNPDLMEG